MSRGFAVLKKIATFGFNLYTLPARVAYRQAAPYFNLPADLNQLLAELRSSSDQAAREVQMVLAGVDAEMRQKTAHLTPGQRQQAANLAVNAAEQHLSMAAVNLLRALWLSASAREQLRKSSHDPSVIDHQ